MSMLENNDMTYEKEVKRYKLKYRTFRCQITTGVVTKALKMEDITFQELNEIIKSNSETLTRLALRIISLLPNGRANISSISYASAISELLYQCDIDFSIHVGFVLPVKIKDTSKYNYSLVNYMYIQGNNGVSYHYFNGVTNDSNFTYMKDDIVEV